MTGMSSGRGRMSQAEVVQDRAADESGDCRDKVVVADELQGCGVGGGGGHYSPTHAQGLKHVVDGVTQPSPAGDGDVFGGRAALKGERAVAQRMGGAQGEDEPVVAHELVADLGRGGLAGSGFEVDVSSSRVMGVGTGFGHEAQTYSGCLGAQGVEQGWAGCRGQSVVPFQNESSLQGCQVDFCENRLGLLDQVVHGRTQSEGAGVGVMVRPVRTRIWSPVARRMRPRVRLIAGPRHEDGRRRRSRCLLPAERRAR